MATPFYYNSKLSRGDENVEKSHTKARRHEGTKKDEKKPTQFLYRCETFLSYCSQPKSLIALKAAHLSPLRLRAFVPSCENYLLYSLQHAVFIFLAVSVLALVGCAAHKPDARFNQWPKSDFFMAAPSQIDQRLDVASLEEYLLALNNGDLAESDLGLQFKEAKKLPENTGKGLNYCYLPRDGCWPAREFVLIRSQHTLWVKVHASDLEEPQPAYITMRQRVPGGWIGKNETAPPEIAALFLKE